MSTESPLDPQFIEQTKQQIRSLVNEIAQLAKTDVAPEEFYGQFLPRVISALAAIGGAVWTTNDDGRLALQYQVNLQEAKQLRESEAAQAQHSRLLYQVLSQGEAALVPPHSGGDGEDKPGNPTEFLLVFGVLKTEMESLGLVEILQRPEAGPATQKGYLRFLTQMCELAGDFLKGHQLRHFAHRQVLWTQLEDFTHVVHTSLDPRDTAYTIANEGRRLIECDRLSVAVRKGKRCKIEAISGQDVFDTRSNAVRLLGKLATAVVATGDAVWYTGDTTDMAPQVEDAVQEYVDEAHSKTVAVLPLKRPEYNDEEDPAKRSAPELPIGALIVEQIEDVRVPPSMVQRVDVVRRHSATALANSLEHQNLFLMPVWRAIGKSRWVVEARTLPKTVSIGVGVLVVLLGLFIWPADFRLESKGTLEPIDKQSVWAGVKGRVDEVLVEHGDPVTKDQLLVRLRDTELEMQITDVRGKLAQTAEQVNMLNRLALDPQLKSEDRVKVPGELASARQNLRSLQLQADELAQKEKELRVLSPIDGQVVTWDLRNRLIRRPVQKGAQLLQVADPKGPWDLELHMPENRMGHIGKAQDLLGKDLDVEFQLATAPGKTFHGKIKEAGLSAEVRGEEGNTVLIKVEIDKEQLPQLRPGATVTGKVYCGRRSIGYCWFHDVLEFVQTRIFFRYF